ncbi:MAG: hypothetical protein H0X02_07400 [Nitrosomonas sp.]|nr:hypothetical protein [Nitrosomonas sp.]
MKTSKFSAKLPLLLLTLSAFCAVSSFVAAQTEVAGNDHEVLEKHYENLAKEAKARLQENIAVLEEYEVNPYYYGRQTQGIRSHTSANIREYEEALKENLDNADSHKEMALEQNNRINKEKTHLDRDFTAVKSSNIFYKEF